MTDDKLTTTLLELRAAAEPLGLEVTIEAAGAGVKRTANLERLEALVRRDRAALEEERQRAGALEVRAEAAEAATRQEAQDGRAAATRAGELDDQVKDLTALLTRREIRINELERQLGHHGVKAVDLVRDLRSELGMVCNPDALLEEVRQWRRDVADALGLDEHSEPYSDRAAGILEAARNAVLLDGQDGAGTQPAAAPPSSQAPPPVGPPSTTHRGGPAPDVADPTPEAVADAVLELERRGARVMLPGIAQIVGLTGASGRLEKKPRGRLQAVVVAAIQQGLIREAGPYKRGMQYASVGDPVEYDPPSEDDTTDAEHVAAKRQEVDAAAAAVEDLEEATANPAGASRDVMLEDGAQPLAKPATGTLEGRILTSASASPASIAELAMRLDAPRRDVAPLVAKLKQGELEEKGEVDGVRQYGAVTGAGAI